MKPGDMVRIIPEMEGREDYKILLDDPPNFTNIYTKNQTGRFRYNDVGIVLEQRFVGEGDFSPIPKNFWIKLLCSSGCGWIKRCDLELV